MEFSDALERESNVTLSQATITRFMGVLNFSQRFQSPVTVVIGNNATGKSSIAEAIRGGLASEPDPLGLGPRNRKLYGHNGASSSVSLEFMGRGGTRVMSPTEGKVSGSVMHPQSGITVGLQRPFELRTDKELSEFWDRVVRVQLGRDDIMKACARKIENLPEPMRNSVWNFLVDYADKSIPDECGHDKLKDLHAKFRSRRTETYGAISALCRIKENVKGENIMSRAVFPIDDKDQHWTPKTIDSAISVLEEEMPRYVVEESGQEKVAKQQAEARRDTVEELRKTELAIEDHLRTGNTRRATLNEHIKELEASVRVAIAKVSELRAEAKIYEMTLSCPKCKAGLFYDPANNSLREADNAKRADEKQRAAKIDEWERHRKNAEISIKRLVGRKEEDSEAVAQAKRERDALKRQLETIDRAIKDREDSAEQARQEGRVPISAGDYNSKMMRIMELKEARRVVQDREKVRGYSYRLHAEDLLIETLNPGGLVASQRHKSHQSLMNVIALIEKAAGASLGQVEIAENGMVTIGGQPHATASKSERVWANWMMQAAFTVLYTKRRPRPVMLVDEIDIFDTAAGKAFSRSIEKVDELVRAKGGTAQFILFGTGAADVTVWAMNTEHAVQVIQVRGRGQAE